MGGHARRVGGRGVPQHGVAGRARRPLFASLSRPFFPHPLLAGGALKGATALEPALPRRRAAPAVGRAAALAPGPRARPRVDRSIVEGEGAEEREEGKRRASDRE